MIGRRGRALILTTGLRPFGNRSSESLLANHGVNQGAAMLTNHRDLCQCVELQTADC